MTLGAALIAVRGVGRQIGNWRHEVPGRRRLEIAENCLTAALEQKRLIEIYRDTVVEAMDLVLFPERAVSRMLEHEEESGYWERLEREIEESGAAVWRGYATLRTTTNLASIYFTGSIEGALHKMRDAGAIVGSRYDKFFNELKNEEVEERSRERELLVVPAHLNSDIRPQEETAVQMYSKVLLSELSRPQPSRGLWAEAWSRLTDRVSPCAWRTLDYVLPRRRK